MMKRVTLATVCLACAVIFLFSKGDTAYGPERSENYVPVYMTRAELEGSVKYLDGERGMSDPGKIYVYGDRIFVNEKYRGVHVIDNSDPYNPRRTGFIVAPGCIDMAVKGNIIYVDNAWISSHSIWCPGASRNASATIFRNIPSLPTDGSTTIRTTAPTVTYSYDGTRRTTKA